MKCDVINLDNQKVGDIELDDSVFGVAVRNDLMARVLNWQLAKRRAGTHMVKDRSLVSGTTHKPFRQKGTGRARQGSARAPQFRGGGTVFGPVVRDHAFDLPKKVRKAGLKSALASKIADGKMIILDSAKLDAPKTKELAARVKAFGWSSALVIDGGMVDGNFLKASANIVGLDVLPTIGANVYDILRRDTLVLTKDAVEKLVERLK